MGDEGGVGCGGGFGIGVEWSGLGVTRAMIGVADLEGQRYSYSVLCCVVVLCSLTESSCYFTVVFVEMVRFCLV